MNSPDKVLSARDVAAQLGVHERTAQRRMKSGAIASVARAGSRRVVTQLDLWRHLGLADEMLALWRDAIARRGGQDGN